MPEAFCQLYKSVLLLREYSFVLLVNQVKLNTFLVLGIYIFQEKIGLLLGTGGKTFKRIGSLFKVHIHLTSGHHQSGEWVSIYGKEDDRARAKVGYVNGLRVFRNSDVIC